MMSAALLTAAAAGILPHLIPSPGTSPMPSPIVGILSPQSPGMPSTLPSGSEAIG
jgi:hypothetical protein